MSDIAFEVIVSRIKLRIRNNPNPNPKPKPKRTTANFNFHYHSKLLVADGGEFDDFINLYDFPKKVYTASKHNPLPFRSTRTTVTSALSKITDLDPEFHPIITRHVIAFARRSHHRNPNPNASIDVDISEVSGSFLVTDECMCGWERYEYGHWNMTHGWIDDDDDDKNYDVVKYLDNMTSFVKVPCQGRGDLKAVSYDIDEVTRIGTCAICLESLDVDFDPDEEAMILMNVLKMPCGHVFHRECIVSWIRSNCDCVTPTCPLCRATMEFL